MRKKQTPNYKIMFDSAVSYLKSINTTYNKVRRAKFDMETLHVGYDGYYFICYDKQGYDDLVDRESELFAERERAYKEVERLRELLNNAETSNDNS